MLIGTVIPAIAGIYFFKLIKKRFSNERNYHEAKN